MRPRRNSQRAACPCSATSFRNDPGELLPAQIPLCNGYRLNRRNHDERPIEPRDESARRTRTLEASPKYASQGDVERYPLADQRPAWRTVWRGNEIKHEA